MRQITLMHEKLNEIENVVGFVENCTVSEKKFDFYRLMQTTKYSRNWLAITYGKLTEKIPVYKCRSWMLQGMNSVPCNNPLCYIYLFYDPLYLIQVITFLPCHIFQRQNIFGYFFQQAIIYLGYYQPDVFQVCPFIICGLGYDPFVIFFSASASLISPCFFYRKVKGVTPLKNTIGYLP